MDNSLYLSSGVLLLIAFVAIAWRFSRRPARAVESSPLSFASGGDRSRLRAGEVSAEARLDRIARRGNDEAPDDESSAGSTNGEALGFQEPAAEPVAEQRTEPEASSPSIERPADDGRDAVTGIPNRARFLDEFKRRIAALRQRPEPHGLAMVRIDGFGELLSNYGLRASEIVLAGAAERLGATMREGDVVARFDRDTFVLSLADLSERDAAGAVERLRQSVCQEIELDADRRVTVTASSSFLAVDPSTDAAQLVACCRGALAMTKCGETFAAT